MYTPPRKALLIEVEDKHEVCVVRLKGRLVTGTDPILLQAKTDEIKSQNCDRVLADLRELLSIGSTGIGFLVRVYISVTKRSNGRFVVVGPNRRVREVLALTGLSTVFPLVSDMVFGLAILRRERPEARSTGKG